MSDPGSVFKGKVERWTPKSADGDMQDLTGRTGDPFPDELKLASIAMPTAVTGKGYSTYRQVILPRHGEFEIELVPGEVVEGFAVYVQGSVVSKALSPERPCALGPNDAHNYVLSSAAGSYGVEWRAMCAYCGLARALDPR